MPSDQQHTEPTDDPNRPTTTGPAIGHGRRATSRPVGRTSIDRPRRGSGRAHRSGQAGVPATVWAPPPYAVGQAWRTWVIAAVRHAFLPANGRWLDLTPQLRPTDSAAAAAPDGGHDHRPAGVRVVPFWAPLVADVGLGRSCERFTAPTRDRGLIPDGRVDGEAAVVFVDLGDSAVDDRLGMLAARALQPGGILAVLTRCRHTDALPPELVDPTGMVVASAQNADLLYLQHIVIPLAPLTPPPHGQAPPASGDRPAAPAHHSAHADLLLFARSGHPRPAPDTAAEATR